MILFNLLCSSDHSFECWFRDGATCEAQVAAGEVVCPECGDTLVRKAPMAPHIGRKDASSDVAAELRRALRTLQQHVEAHADYVGERFAEEARRIHYGETKERAIYGEATRAETQSLRDEGIEAVVVPWVRRRDS